jgi:cation transport ATPase
VPVDGVVLDGTTTIDESMVTGEPIPVEKTQDAKVTGGTVNGTGAFIMRAERVGSDTLLAQIVRMVSEAQRSRAPIQRLADTVAGWFVPAVIAVSVVTFIVWSGYGPEPRLAHALVNAVAVLIIACPCALGLATPMSIMVGTGRGAEGSVLIRNAEALEILEKVTTIVVDKTGTLTEGKPKLVTIEPQPGIDAATLLRLTASLEHVSEHPLAAAIVGGARERKIDMSEVTNFASATGKGVTGTVDGRTVAIGNLKHLVPRRRDFDRLSRRAPSLRGRLNRPCSAESDAAPGNARCAPPPFIPHVGATSVTRQETSAYFTATRTRWEEEGVRRLRSRSRLAPRAGIGLRQQGQLNRPAESDRLRAPFNQSESLRRGTGALGIDPGQLKARAEELRREGQTVMFVAVDGKTAGLVGVADPIKLTTHEAIEALHREGIKVAMLTGDNRTTAEAVAKSVGIDRIEADVLPDQKAEVIKRLQASGERVAMAGDGINDAPALAQADVGIAMGTGTDVAMESAGVTLVKGDLRGIVRARRLSSVTMRNIRQNLFFAFIYNVAGVPIAAGILYPWFGLLLSPMIASAAMTFSSVSVIGNALRLRRVSL